MKVLIQTPTSSFAGKSVYTLSAGDIAANVRIAIATGTPYTMFLRNEHGVETPIIIGPEVLARSIIVLAEEEEGKTDDN